MVTAPKSFDAVTIQAICLGDEGDARSDQNLSTLLFHSLPESTHHGKNETRHSSNRASQSVGLLPGQSDGDRNDARSEKGTLRAKDQGDEFSS